MSNQKPEETIHHDAIAPSEQGPKSAEVKNHTIYTTNQKRLIVFVAAIAALFSPMSANIYMPALETLADYYKVSNALINLTVMTYLIFQGLAPTFVGGFSDDAGRRPAYAICFIIYLGANIGLAVQKNYAALLVLRMVQSAGSSGTVALANAVVADVVTSAERGSYIGYASVPAILGPAISPIFGGILSQFAGWRWIFWFLTIFAISFFVPLLLFLPETCRKIVGDGSIPPPLLNYSLLTLLKERKRSKKTQAESEAEQGPRPKPQLRFPNPLTVLTLIFNKLSGILLFSSGLLFCCYYVISTSIASEFQRNYGFNDFQISLVFLPFGAGSLISAFTTGKIIDWNYARHAKRLNMPLQKSKQDDLSNFPIERARLEVSMPLLYVAATGIAGYGWLLEADVHVAGPCVMLFVIGYAIIAGFNCMSILMVDIYPGRPATATAANNLIRCLLGAVAISVLAPLIKVMGIGWTTTFFSGLFVVFSPTQWWLMKKGPQWRREAKEEEERKKREYDAKKGDVEASAAAVEDETLDAGVKGGEGHRQEGVLDEVVVVKTVDEKKGAEQ